MGGLRLNLLGRAEAPRLMGRALTGTRSTGIWPPALFTGSKASRGRRASALRRLARTRTHAPHPVRQMSATAILHASSAVTFAARAVRRASARVGSSPPWRALLSPRYIHLLVFSDGSDPPRLGDAADLPPPPSFAAPSARRETRSPISRRHRREFREEG
jgi:hypothetical protein